MNSIVLLVLLVSAVTLLLLLAWWVDDPSRFSLSRSVEASRSSSGLRAWFIISGAVAAIAGLLLITLVAAFLCWAWLPARLGQVLAPTGAVVVAAIASAGAARTLMAQSDVAEANRLEDTNGLWQRFDKGADQLANNNFAIRVAGVYSLVGLADDWLRRYERLEKIGLTSRVNIDECETIVHLLCAQLRRNTHVDENLNPFEAREEELVNEAIISQMKWHLAIADDAQDQGMWARKELLVDLRSTDLSNYSFNGIDLKGAVLNRANLYNTDLVSADLTDTNFFWADLRKANLKGATITAGTNFDNVIFDADTEWPDSVQVERAPKNSPFQLRVQAVDTLAWCVVRRDKVCSPAWEIPTGTPRSRAGRG